MKAFYVGNLKPSDIAYLQENVSSVEVRTDLLEQLDGYLKSKATCIASLDEVFCNATMLRGVMNQLSDDSLSEIFESAVNEGAHGKERSAAFLDALGRERDAKFRPLVKVARKFG